MNSKAIKKNTYESDWKLYNEFIQDWTNTLLSDQNYVYQMVSKISKQICTKYDCMTNFRWLQQVCLIYLSKEKYKRESPLKIYIQKIVLGELKRIRKEKY